MEKEPENIVFERIRQGDLEAFENYYFEMQPRLYAFSRKFIEEEEVSRDMVQEIFYELWENRNKYKVNDSLNAYLFRTLHNKCLNYIRSLRVKEKYASYTDLKMKEAELVFFDLEQEGYRSIFFQEVQKIFEDSMLHLPEGCREIFLLSRVEGLSNKAIADKLNISVRTVESQIYKALKTLKTNFKDYLPLFPFLFFRLFE